jgi:hypothetical protein
MEWFGKYGGMSKVDIYPGGTGYAGYGPQFEAEFGANDQIIWKTINSATCTWNGSVSTAWENSANWSSCTNGRADYPDQFDKVVIPGGIANQPRITTPTVFAGFGAGAAGGTLTFNALWGGIAKVISTMDTVQSDVTLKGETTNCSLCSLELYDGGTFEIVNDAILTLDQGMMLWGRYYGNAKDLKIGNGVTGGTLKAVSGATEDTKPAIGVSLTRVVLNGASGSLAVLDIDGLRAQPWNNSGQDWLLLQDQYSIAKFDKVTFNATNLNGGWAFVRFADCTNAYVSDTTWASLDFGSVGSGYNIRADGLNCSGLPAVSVNPATGAGAGATYQTGGNFTW